MNLHMGLFPDGMIVRHDCDTPRCVNPAHLRLGTHKDNVRDMVNRRRAAWQKPGFPRGEASRFAKLCELDVIRLRRRQMEAGRVFQAGPRIWGNAAIAPRGHHWRNVAARKAAPGPRLGLPRPNRDGATRAYQDLPGVLSVFDMKARPGDCGFDATCLRQRRLACGKCHCGRPH